uniref:Uncharacterized protein n=1 Tax=Chromera velia CCMP2878 TaxID=1169474 RepID=A0A0G4GR27_9ALVE|eukprot:Cvel_22993.t1-p1 / transcript=Cvel_22993.t1 / gene=Cvel_22993 / organism=Chromera_velia_CCMP2878 / gene_product=hypothetical protein / transcript_product=hypothetical protein / location=Cvel_scaffold2320:2385-10241(+) / protein_length=1404 / sequence_SO=supercontig / SO=protein_coding / is_pseudo=false
MPPPGGDFLSPLEFGCFRGLPAFDWGSVGVSPHASVDPIPPTKEEMERMRKRYFSRLHLGSLVDGFQKEREKGIQEGSKEIGVCAGTQSFPKKKEVDEEFGGGRELRDKNPKGGWGGGAEGDDEFPPSEFSPARRSPKAERDEGDNGKSHPSAAAAAETISDHQLSRYVCRLPAVGPSAVRRPSLRTFRRLALRTFPRWVSGDAKEGDGDGVGGKGKEGVGEKDRASSEGSLSDREERDGGRHSFRSALARGWSGDGEDEAEGAKRGGEAEGEKSPSALEQSEPEAAESSEDEGGGKEATEGDDQFTPEAREQYKQLRATRDARVWDATRFWIRMATNLDGTKRGIFFVPPNGYGVSLKQTPGGGRARRRVFTEDKHGEYAYEMAVEFLHIVLAAKKEDGDAEGIARAQAEFDEKAELKRLQENGGELRKEPEWNFFYDFDLLVKKDKRLRDNLPEGFRPERVAEFEEDFRKHFPEELQREEEEKKIIELKKKEKEQKKKAARPSKLARERGNFPKERAGEIVWFRWMKGSLVGRLTDPADENNVPYLTDEVLNLQKPDCYLVLSLDDNMYVWAKKKFIEPFRDNADKQIPILMRGAKKSAKRALYRAMQETEWFTHPLWERLEAEFGDGPPGRRIFAGGGGGRAAAVRIGLEGGRGENGKAIRKAMQLQGLRGRGRGRGRGGRGRSPRSLGWETEGEEKENEQTQTRSPPLKFNMPSDAELAASLAARGRRGGGRGGGLRLRGRGGAGFTPERPRVGGILEAKKKLKEREKDLPGIPPVGLEPSGFSKFGEERANRKREKLLKKEKRRKQEEAQQERKERDGGDKKKGSHVSPSRPSSDRRKRTPDVPQTTNRKEKGSDRGTKQSLTDSAGGKRATPSNQVAAASASATSRNDPLARLGWVTQGGHEDDPFARRFKPRIRSERPSRSEPDAAPTDIAPESASKEPKRDKNKERLPVTPAAPPPEEPPPVPVFSRSGRQVKPKTFSDAVVISLHSKIPSGSSSSTHAAAAVAGEDREKQETEGGKQDSRKRKADERAEKEKEKGTPPPEPQPVGREDVEEVEPVFSRSGRQVKRRTFLGDDETGERERETTQRTALRDHHHHHHQQQQREKRDPTLETVLRSGDDSRRKVAPLSHAQKKKEKEKEELVSSKQKEVDVSERGKRKRDWSALGKELQNAGEREKGEKRARVAVIGRATDTMDGQSDESAPLRRSARSGRPLPASASVSASASGASPSSSPHPAPPLEASASRTRAKSSRARANAEDEKGVANSPSGSASQAHPAEANRERKDVHAGAGGARRSQRSHARRGEEEEKEVETEKEVRGSRRGAAVQQSAIPSDATPSDRPLTRHARRLPPQAAASESPPESARSVGRRSSKKDEEEDDDDEGEGLSLTQMLQRRKAGA